MRPYTFVPGITILGLQWSLLALAEQSERSPLCLKIQKEGRLTPEQADTIVGPWADRQYKEYIEWNTTQTGPGDKFWHWLHNKWATDVSDSIIDCMLSKTCSPVTCRFIDDKHDLKDQWCAYWTLESTAIFHNMAYEIREANEQAWLRVRGDVGTLVASQAVHLYDGHNLSKCRESSGQVMVKAMYFSWFILAAVFDEDRAKTVVGFSGSN